MGAYLDVLLRGLALASQSLVVGGTIFVLVVLRPWRSASPAAASADFASTTATRSRRLIVAGALAVAAAQAASLAVALGALAEGRHWPVAGALSAVYFRIGLARVALAAGAAVLGHAMRRRVRDRTAWWALGAVTAAVVLASAGTSHAAARLEHRALVMGLDALHQAAAGIWVGGLIHLAVAGIGGNWNRWPREVLRRFSAVALMAVSVLVIAGGALTFQYVDGIRGLLGTAYGLMVLTKMLVLGGLLALGASNFRGVRSLGSGSPVSSLRIRRFVEVEVGLGLTALLAAASLTSLPPARDVVADRATIAEVASRLAPSWPRLTSPRFEELPAGDPSAPRTAEDRAWSEYNHHVAGLFVGVMGLLAIAHRTTRGRWAGHWPLAFLGLAGFLFVRDDPGSWPLGPIGFWASMIDPAVLQHRFFVLLVIVFGLFEWKIQTRPLTESRWALVFPLLCAMGGAVLLTHSHATLNVKSEFLMEITHAPLAWLGLVVGCGRWLEVRLPSPRNRFAGRLWPSAMACVGLVLLLYRES